MRLALPVRLAERTVALIRGSLKVKLVLIIVSILGGTIGIAPWSAIKIQERQLLGGAQERLRALHAMLRSTIVPTCMLTGDRNSIQALIESIGGKAEIHQVRLFDTSGVVMYSSSPAERGARLATTEMARYYGKAGPLIQPREHGVVTYTLVEPILNRPPCFSCHAPAQKVLGILEVSLSVSELWNQLRTLRRFAAVATLLTLGVIVVAIWLALTYLVDQPLQDLVRTMGRAETGDLSARATVSKNDEVGYLGRHFNAMISKQQAAQEEIERYHREQMARADRLATIGEMAAAVAHEIRNPLTGIRGTLSVLSRDLPGDDARRPLVREADLLIDRLDKLVEDILIYARPSRPQIQPTDVSELVERALLLTGGAAKKAGLCIVTEPLPRTARGRRLPMVNVDPQQVQQVMVNLILNAIQATDAGGRILIRTRVRVQDDTQTYVCIDVEDNGKGMTPEETEEAFQPFFSTKAQGTGLGLAIAKQIVERHGGRISLRSAVGEGTCAQVEFPAHVPAPA